MSTQQPFHIATTMRLKHTDQAGVVFFPQVFLLAHDCYEAFLEARNLPLSTFIAGPYLLPIVSSHADYKHFLALEDQIQIQLKVEKISSRSFTLSFSFIKEKRVAALVTLTHVCVDKESKKAVPLPEKLKEVLQGESHEFATH